MYNSAMIVVLLVLGAGIALPHLIAQTDWPGYSRDATGQRYSPLAQINAKNVAKLKPAWQYGVDPGAIDLNPATRALTAT